MSIGLRIRDIRNYKSLKQSDFSEMLGLTISNLSQIELGKVKASADLISLICEKIQVSANWLLTGEGEMFLPSQEEQQAQQKPSLGYLEEVFAKKEEVELKADKEELLSLGQAKADKQNLQALAQYVQQLDELIKLHHPPEFGVREATLPYLSSSVAASAGYEAADSQVSEKRVMVPIHIHISRDMYVQRVIGPSMSEVIPDGSLILLKKVATPLDNRTYIMNINQNITIKKFRNDESGMRLVYMDGSGRAIHPDEGDTWECVAQYICIVEEIE